MASVGVREFRDNLSEYLRRVREGELARALTRTGAASWSGGKPKGLPDAPQPRAGLVSVAVIEDRR